MKKILFLLLVTMSSYGQTLQNPTFGNTTTNTLKIKTSATVTSVNFLPAFGADGITISKIDPVNLPFALKSDLLYKRTISQIRSLTGTLPSNTFYTTDLNQEGTWYYDATDTTTADNTGTVLVTSDGKRIKRAYSGAVSALWFGVKNDNTNTQTQMDALLNDASIKTIRFPKGIYQAYFNNRTSNRTFIFDEGSIIDGVVHVAIGSGPDIGGGAIVLVKNVTTIGALTSTVRVGSYYCDGVNADKWVISEINPIYVNQTAEGGSRGVHIYTASKNMNIKEILVESTTLSGYALGIDPATTINAAHTPENISIGKLTVKTTTQLGISILGSKNISIDNAIINWQGTSHGVSITNSINTNINNITIDGTGSTGSGSGIFNLGGTTYINTLITHHCPGNGLYVRSGYMILQNVEAYNNSLDGIRILAKCYIENIRTYSNTQKGVNIATGFTADNTIIQNIESYSNTMDNVFVDGVADVEIGSIKAYSGVSWGVFLNNCVRFKNHYLKSYSNAQGLRYIGNTDCFFDVIDLSGNSTSDFGITGTVSGLTILKATYGTMSGGPLEALPGYVTLERGRLGAIALGDVSVTLTVGSSFTTERFGTALTANRTVTLSTTGAKNGDKFTIVRMPTATGAFTVSVGGLISLSVSQWCTVEFNGTIWVLTNTGNLDESATVTQLNTKANNLLTGYVSGAGAVSGTDTVLQAIQKLNGNDALKADSNNTVLTGTSNVPTPTTPTGIANKGYVDGLAGTQNYSTVVANAATTTIATLTTNATYIGHVSYAADKTKFKSIIIGIGEESGIKQGTINIVNDSSLSLFTVTCVGDVVSINNTSGGSQTFKLSLKQILLN